MKNLFSALLLFASINCYSQIIRETTETNYLNNVIWNQVFNDFNIKIPIFIVTPYFYALGSFNTIDNDVFVKNNLTPDDIFSVNDLIRKEFVRNLNISFFAYLPKDSILLLKALYKDRLLYSFHIQKSDTGSSLEYKLPDALLEKVFFGPSGEMVKHVKNQSGAVITTLSINKGDTLRINSSDNNLKSYSKSEEIRYKNGKLSNNLIFKIDKVTQKRKILHSQIYKYYPDGKLHLILNLNRNNFVADSIVNYYKADTLIGIYHHRIKENPDKVIYTYHNGKLLRKNILRGIEFLQVDYEYQNSRISKLTFLSKKDNTKDLYEFEYNVSGKLIAVIHKIVSSPFREEIKRQFSFYYNHHLNLENIKVINKKRYYRKGNQV